MDDEREHEGDGYLFDRSGPSDPDVERLERLLRPLGHDGAVAAPGGRANVPAGHAAPRPVTSRVVAALALAAAAAVLIVASLSARDDRPLEEWTATGNPGAGQGRWVVTTDVSQEIRLGEMVHVTVQPRTRLQVRSDAASGKLLYLARGGIEARVSADAHPRFFQVETDAARCVDLGCRYTLDVADDGVATVRVLTGQVAFETPDREVFVPAGATSVARKGSGPGTPRFEDAAPAVAAAFDAYDAAPRAERRAAAEAALAAACAPRDTLPVWHLLQDGDPGVVRAAQQRLDALAGACDVPPGASAAEVRAAWKDHLGATCW